MEVGPARETADMFRIKKNVLDPDPTIASFRIASITINMATMQEPASNLVTTIREKAKAVVNGDKRVPHIFRSPICF